MPMAVIDGKYVLASPTTKGVQFFDFTNRMNPSDLGSLALAGVSGGDYTNVAWSSRGPGPTSSSEAAGAVSTSSMRPIRPSRRSSSKSPPASSATSAWAPCTPWATTSRSPASISGEGLSVMNMSDVTKPFLLTTSTQTTMYSSLTIGDMIFGVGEGANYTFLKWTPDAITKVGQKKIGTDKGGYCTYQDGFAFCGQSKDGFHKLDLRQYDIASIKEVGVGKPSSASGEAGGDFDFATVLGNLVYLGNDHGSGASLIPHQWSGNDRRLRC